MPELWAGARSSVELGIQETLLDELISALFDLTLYGTHPTVQEAHSRSNGDREIVVPDFRIEIITDGGARIGQCDRAAAQEPNWLYCPQGICGELKQGGGMESSKRKYLFSWDLIGNIDLGRPNLGRATSLEVYRLMQFCFRDVMEQELGTVKTDRLFYEAGKLAGKQFYQHVIGPVTEFDGFVKRVQGSLKELGIGIFRVERADLETGSFVFTVSEDLDCSGLPELDYETCIYDEGFIAGLMESFTGKTFKVKEVDCWCTGDRTCRFAVDKSE